VTGRPVKGRTVENLDYRVRARFLHGDGNCSHRMQVMLRWATIADHAHSRLR
jgi:hypothetical protein